MDTQTIDVREVESLNNKQLRELHALSYNVIQWQLKGLEGEILTIVEASTQDTEQRKAQKDLVKQMFSKKYRWLNELCYPSNEGLSKTAVGSVK
jgi:hypothetical protein